MNALRFVVGRLLGALAVLVVVAAVTFVLFYVLPSDPARSICDKPCTPDRLAQARAFLGTGQPWWRQFGDYLGGIVAGRRYGSGAGAVTCAAPCFGYSFQLHQSVTSLLWSRFPTTASIAVGAAVLWLVAGVASGVVAALRAGRAVDRAVMTIAVAGVSAPAYLVGLLAILLFAFTVHWLPSGGYVPLTQDPLSWAWHLLLPWCALAFISAAVYARLTRGQLLDVLGEDYVRTARAKGLSERRVVTRHGLRNALLPVVTVFGLDLGSLLGGAVLTEHVFSMQGIGSLLIQAVSTSDLQIVVGTTLFAATLIVVANAVVDVLYRFLDPRVRPGG